MNKRIEDITKIVEIINVDGEEFCPLVELLGIAITDIFGSEEGLTPMLECYKDGDTAFGIITHHYDDRIGFTLSLEKGWKDFKLTIERADMKLDQLQLFDKLTEWGFDLRKENL